MKTESLVSSYWATSASESEETWKHKHTEEDEALVQLPASRAKLLQWEIRGRRLATCRNTWQAFNLQPVQQKRLLGKKTRQRPFLW